jgi:tetratricopeptide (TPR) repeat protein
MVPDLPPVPPMADSAMGLDRTASNAGYSPVVSGDTGSAARAPQSPFLAVDSGLADQTEFAILLNRAIQNQEAGNLSDAELCFKAALDVGDRTLDASHPDLMMLLNDLTRLYLKQSEFASAEPLLLRLFELKRTKGENHPEVATVLASLATVRQALGRHESAEQLWRRVLDIRERTLAPNHFAIAIALEHLGDSCAARGKIREALSALEQALTIRERTLGVAHPSLRVVRDRIADLKLQASEDSLSAGADIDAELLPAPERYRLLSGGAAPAASVSRPSQAPTASVSVSKPAQVQAAPKSERVATLMIPRAQSLEKRASESASESDEGETVSALQAATVPYRDILDSIREEMEAPKPSIALRVRTAVASLVPSPAKKHVTAALVASALVLLLVGGAASSRSWGENGTSVAALAPSRNVSLPALGVVPSSKAAEPTVDSRPIVNEPAEKLPVARPHVDERPSTRKPVEKKPEAKTIAIPTLSNAISSRLDSLAAKAASAPTESGAAFAVPGAPAAIASRRTGFGDAQLAGAQRARLIGELPTPHVAQAVSEVQGEVVVRFTVGVDGRPVMSSLAVVKSPNQYLTAAVQKEIPTLRFEPARTGGSDPKAVTDVVEIAYKFSKGSH